MKFAPHYVCRPPNLIDASDRATDRAKEMGTLFRDYTDDIGEASEAALERTKLVRERLDKGTSDLKTAADRASEKATEIGAGLQELLTSISGRLKQAFDGHGHTLHVVTERSGERIDEMVETLGRQTNNLSKSLRENVRSAIHRLRPPARFHPRKGRRNRRDDGTSSRRSYREV